MGGGSSVYASYYWCHNLNTSWENNFTATRNSTVNTQIGFPDIGGFSYTPFMQLRTIVGFTSFVGATATSFQLFTYNSSGQAVDTNYAFSCIEHFNIINTSKNIYNNEFIR